MPYICTICRLIDTVEQALDHEDPSIRLAAATLILRSTKLREIGPPDGEVDQNMIALQMLANAGHY